MKLINKIIIGLIVTGFSFLIVGFSLGGSTQLQSMYENNVIHFGLHNQRMKEDQFTSGEYTNIHNLHIDINKYNVIVEPYIGNTIKVEGTIDRNIDIHKNGNTLVIQESKRYYASNRLFNFGFNNNGKLFIYIPEEMEFNKVNISVGVGEVRAKATLKANEINLEVDMGSIEVESIICEEGTFEAEIGIINIAHLDSKNSDFTVSIGSIKAILSGEEEEYSYNAICNAGEITIGSYQLSGLISKDIGGDGLRFIKAECDIGNIDIEMKGR